MTPSARIHWLFILLALVVCALVNPGNFGTIDTVRRWQVARSIRLPEPEVTAEDAGQGFGIAGKDGVLHAWYGIGQSLLLLPFDAMEDFTLDPLLRRVGVDPVRRRQMAELTIAFFMQAALTAGLLILARRVLLDFGFGGSEAVAGALALLFATTCLHYVQSAQENELLLVLALASMAAIRAWHRQGRRRWPLLAGAACGAAILVRLPSLLEAGLFACFAIAAGSNPRRFLSGFLPPVGGALLLDRWYHWLRFGEISSTYIGIFGRLHRPTGEPPSFPFSYPFWKGFTGTFFSLDKSIFLFDPLLILLIVLVARNWRSFSSPVSQDDRATSPFQQAAAPEAQCRPATGSPVSQSDRATSPFQQAAAPEAQCRPARASALRLLLAILALLLFAYAAAYAKYYDFGGDVAWGHRFVLLPVQLLCLFAVPLLLRRRAPALWLLVGASVILQIASTLISPSVEVRQRNMGFSQGVLWNRAVNLEQIARNREDPRRFAGIPPELRTLSYFPFQLRFRFQALAGWAIAAWTLMLLSVPVLLAALWRQARRSSAPPTLDPRIVS